MYLIHYKRNQYSNMIDYLGSITLIKSQFKDFINTGTVLRYYR